MQRCCTQFECTLPEQFLGLSTTLAHLHTCLYIVEIKRHWLTNCSFSYLWCTYNSWLLGTATLFHDSFKAFCVNSDFVIEENWKTTRIVRRFMWIQAELGSEKKEGGVNNRKGGAINAVNTVSQSLCLLLCPSIMVRLSVGRSEHPQVLFSGGGEFFHQRFFQLTRMASAWEYKLQPVFWTTLCEAVTLSARTWFFSRG